MTARNRAPYSPSPWVRFSTPDGSVFNPRKTVTFTMQERSAQTLLFPGGHPSTRLLHPKASSHSPNPTHPTIENP